MNDLNTPPHIVLKKTEPGDLETLFIHQLDEEYAHMAAFMNEKYKDKNAYLAKWNKLLAEGVNIRTILLGDAIVGSVATWQFGDELNITYGIGKEYWNRGIATAALQQFLAIAPQRPLFGRTAFDNVASAKVLEKCGFKKINEDTAFAFTRKKEIAELVFLLEA
ncbi:MAG: acetyltransferase, ribosomal protein N-acetylase [Flavipsychrobacter sp.]|jgi:RimJ/RimL family protein N-acetyltransferase|nr:acetyltransferase, ribosomal protein N-acetylase [Flavipsychrobacter sp.]